jgi:hypothetical protein
LRKVGANIGARGAVAVGPAKKDYMATRRRDAGGREHRGDGRLASCEDDPARISVRGLAPDSLSPPSRIEAAT